MLPKNKKSSAYFLWSKEQLDRVNKNPFVSINGEFLYDKERWYAIYYEKKDGALYGDLMTHIFECITNLKYQKPTESQLNLIMDYLNEFEYVYKQTKLKMKIKEIEKVFE